ncbi:MAG: tetratricopeptide repeat protein [Promethearchaeota archaeon]
MVNDEEQENEIQRQIHANILLGNSRKEYESGNYDKAIDLLKEVLELLPDNASVWYELALCYRENGDTDAEIECYKKIIDLGGDDGDIWMQMALAYRILGKHPEELYCLVMVADRGLEGMHEEGTKNIIIDRYQELTRQKVIARNPMSNEYKVPIFEPRPDDEDEHYSTCIICFKKINLVEEEGKVLMCPHCKRLGHFVCFASWLQEKQICPVCHGPLDFNLDNYDIKKIMGVSDETSDHAGDA